jgi:hypothetical protein
MLVYQRVSKLSLVSNVNVVNPVRTKNHPQDGFPSG